MTRVSEMRRDVALPVEFTEAEIVAVIQRAIRRKMSPSDYVRRLVLKDLENSRTGQK